ncbi:MAG TPA: prolyl oligopeptidase family serine peptidase [Kineosporiaceae bacterium]
MEADELGFAPPPGRPAAARRPVVHQAHGVQRIDDYAWLRDVGDPAAQEYLRTERAYYLSTTAPLEPVRRRLEAEMLARTPPADASVAWQRSGLIYFTRSEWGEEHDRLYRLDPVTMVEHLVLDPNDVARGAPFLELGAVDPSPDGALVAYSMDTGGEEVFELRFRDIATGADLPERIPGVTYGGAWSADGRQYLYVVADARGRAHQVHRHVLGTPPDADVLVLVEPDPRFALDVTASRDAGWILITAGAADSSEVHLVSAHDPAERPRCVASRRDGVDYLVEPLPGGWDGTGDDLLLIVTDDGAPEFRLMQTRVPPAGGSGRAADWQPVAGLPSAGERLESAVVLHRHVVLVARRDGEPFLRVIDRPSAGADLLPRPRTRELHPGVPLGQLRLWHPEDPATSTIVIVEENLVTAPAWVAIDLFTGARAVIKRTPVPRTDPTAYVTERLHATAPDGVQVPVTIARRRDARRGRTTGLLLTGYGAYETCSWPQFDVGTLSLLDRGMVVGVAHVRGGGELGRHWWTSSRRASKPTTFVDYVAVRDALVAAGWAGEVRGGARVATRGVSAGGLLQAVVFSRAPRMWRAVVAEVPFVDVVTTLSDHDLPLAEEERDEWGDPVHSAAEFAAMLAWSPYDNPPPPGRPALLVTAAVHDRRVLVHEPAKWVARLRATDDPRNPSPLLLRVELGEGTHAGPSGRFARLRYEAEILAWVLAQLRLS